MRLPRVLAVAVGSILVAGGGSALALGSPGRAMGSATLTGTARELAGPSHSVTPARVAASTSASTGAASTSTSDPSTGSSSRASHLAVPAGGAPVSSGLDPAASAPPAARGNGPAVTLPVPAAATLPPVSGKPQAITPDAVVMLNAPLTSAQATTLSKLRGVTRLETVDTGNVAMGGQPVVAFGVDPASFRDFTPAASASSDQLWQYLAGGSLVSSYEMADDRALHLGSFQTVVPAASAPDSAVKGWLGAFASIGLPGVDLLVDHTYSPELGLTPDSGVVVSAPGLDGATLQQELQSALPGAAVELLHADQLPTSLPGDTLGSTTRQRILAAALSRVGLPYVWGATGPNSFDCSGLVQWAYRQAGVLMPRVAAEQFLTGDHIPLAAAQPGDLLFWTYDPSDPGYVDHVAIYLGNGMMVVAPHTGTSVQVAQVPTADFAGAVQVVLAR